MRLWIVANLEFHRVTSRIAYASPLSIVHTTGYYEVLLRPRSAEESILMVQENKKQVSDAAVGRYDVDADVEGLDDLTVSGWGEYPLDTVFVRTEHRTVGEVVKRILADRYQLNPDFQRDFVWPLKKQSRLIESCLMRIPLPVFYVAEGRDGRIIVVDGVQRLTTFIRFVENEFSLTGLGGGESSKDSPLAGKRFRDLPISLQERIEDTQITLYILDEKAPERARLDIFERVNSGEPLTRQQMRNSLYNGPGTAWLRDASKMDVFISATGGSLQPKTMRDREAINRFCAFYLLGVQEYRGDMDGFLADCLISMNNKNEEELNDLSNRFKYSMQANKLFFGNHAFRKSLVHYGKYVRRSVLNMSFFDVCSVIFAEIQKVEVKEMSEEIKRSFQTLLENDEFVHSITYSTNSTRQVKKRFQIAREAVNAVLG